jgi:hypothetical protein
MVAGLPRVMKTTHTFKGSWFGFAILAAIVVAEFIAWRFSSGLDLHINPITVAFGAAGLVALVASLMCEGWKSESD